MNFGAIIMSINLANYSQVTVASALFLGEDGTDRWSIFPIT